MEPARDDPLRSVPAPPYAHVAPPASASASASASARGRGGRASVAPAMENEKEDPLPPLTAEEEEASRAAFAGTTATGGARRRTTVARDRASGVELDTFAGTTTLRSDDGDADTAGEGQATTTTATAKATKASWARRAGSACAEGWSTFIGSMGIALGYVVADNIKHKRSLIIGVTTVFLVVCFLGLIENVLNRSPVVFVKLAEDQVGQYDMLFTALPTNASNTFFLNYTSMNASLSDVDAIYGAAPRWFLVGDVLSIEDSTLNSSAVLMIIDSELEASIGLGRAWKHRALGLNEMHLTSSTVRRLGLQPNAGERLMLNIDLSSLLGAVSGSGGLANLIGNGVPLVNVTLPSVNLSSIVITIPGTNFTVDLGTIVGGLNQTAVNATLANIIDAINQQISGAIPNFLSYQQEYTLIDAVDYPDGKYPATLGNVAVLELAYFETAVKESIIGSLNSTLIRLVIQQLNLTEQVDAALELVAGFDLRENALTVIAMLTDRLTIYTLSSTDRDLAMLAVSNDVSDHLGIDFAAEVTYPLVLGVDATNFIRIFLDEIFFAVIGVLVILAVMLIYALLLSDVEERTFEYGMLRTLGMRQVVLVPLLVMQSLLFSVPGILAGLLVCFILYVPIDVFLSLFAKIPVDVYLQPAAIILGVLLGVFMPVFGVIIPIRRALSQTLRDSLDVYHNTVNDSIIKVQRLENIGASATETIIAILLVVIGFVVYYLVPLSFIFGDIAFFFRILTLILLGMVIGEVLMTQSIEVYVEQVLVWCIIWGRDRILAHIVVKNLYAHRPRNQKTAAMFTLCVGFVIFAATMFVLQAQSIPQNLEWAAGADITASASGFSDPLPEAAIREYLNGLLTSNVNGTGNVHEFAVVEGYTFLTFPMTSDNITRSTRSSGISTVRTRRIVIYGVEENYLEVTKDDYLIVTEVRAGTTVSTLPSGKLNIIEALYQPLDQGNPYVAPTVTVPADVDVYASGVYKLKNETAEFYATVDPVIMSETFRDGLYVDTTTRMTMQVQYNLDDNSNSQRVVLVQPVVMVAKMPGLLNYNRLTINGSPMLLSMNDFVDLSNTIANDAGKPKNYTVQSMPKQTILVRLTEDATWYQIEAVVNGLNSLLTGLSDLSITNLRYQIEQTKLASDMIIIFFDVVAIIGLIFCFFMLWLSFTANIRENAWEYGVLRALGLTASTVLRLYVYEAMVIVLACLILGTALGILTASIVTLQINLFTQSPFEFVFPTALFILVVVLSITVSVAGSYFAARQYRRKEVAIALRG